MSKINIPRTIGAAEKKLNSLGELATATEWERAAIVAAYVHISEGRGKRNVSSDISPSDFAKLGIHGLTSHNSVRLYVRAWSDIVDEDGNVVGQRERPTPGKAVELPNDPWPPTRTGTDGINSPEGAEKTIEKIITKHGPTIIAKQTAKPEVAKEVVRNKEANKSIHRAQSSKNREAIHRRKERIAAADPAVAAQIAAVVDAGQTAAQNMSMSAGYTAFQRGMHDMFRNFGRCAKEESFTPMDWRQLLSNVYPLERFVERLRAGVDAWTEGEDPYAAMKEIFEEQTEERERLMDEAEAGTDIDLGLDEIEAWANQGS